MSTKKVQQEIEESEIEETDSDYGDVDADANVEAEGDADVEVADLDDVDADVDLGDDYQADDTEIQPPDDPDVENCDEDEFEEIYTDTDPTNDFTNLIENNDQPNPPFITKYELTKVLAIRTTQLDNDAPPTVEPEFFPDKIYPKDTQAIAKMEIKLQRSPFIIKRPMPNGEYRLVPVSKLMLNEDLG